MRKLTQWVHHLFVPSHRNNFRARILHLDFLFVLIIAGVILSSLTQWANTAQVLGFATDIRVDQLFSMTNDVRRENGLPPLKYSNQLAYAAQNKAQHMFQNNYWAHFGAGKSPWDFILASGYSYEVAGENLAKGFMFTDGVMQGWKNSPTHFANLVKPEYDDVGFAVVNGQLEGEDTTLVVQMFGKRLADSPPVPDKTRTQIAETGKKGAFGIGPVQASGVENSKPAVAPQPKEETDYSPQATVKNAFMSLTKLQFNWSSIVFGLLLFVLFVDLLFAHKFNMTRLTGKNMAHIIFILAIIIGLLIIKNGSII